MSRKIKWGILSTAEIGTSKVIPAMQKGLFSEVVAIASRDQSTAQQSAQELGIPKAYGSYESLLKDQDIDAVYNPLPNHLHVPWSIRAAYEGKHVLCEKPISLTVKEARQLIQVRDQTGVKIQEAFMVRTHPQWLRVRDLVRDGTIGDLVAIQYVFSYCNLDPNNIRNRSDLAGSGVTMDIGCYPITTSRFLFEEEPLRVMALIDWDPQMRIDRLASCILDFSSGQASFLCCTQMVPYQRVQIFGTKARLEIEIPFNAPNDCSCRIFLDEGDILGKKIITEQFEPCDQYTIQGDLFSKAILAGSATPIPLEDSLANMQVVEALFRSAKTGYWEVPQSI